MRNAKAKGSEDVSGVGMEKSQSEKGRGGDAARLLFAAVKPA